jgi:hypothetical protein
MGLNGKITCFLGKVAGFRRSLSGKKKNISRGERGSSGEEEFSTNHRTRAFGTDTNGREEFYY